MEKIKNNQFEIKPIEETPFAILKDIEKNEIWIILGNEKIKKCKNTKEAETQTRYYKWDILGPVIYKIATDAAVRKYNEIHQPINKK